MFVPSASPASSCLDGVSLILVLVRIWSFSVGEEDIVKCLIDPSGSPDTPSS